MVRTVKALTLGAEHIGAKIRTTAIGWTMEGELAEVHKNISDYYLYLRPKASDASVMVLKDADVTILEEAPIRHPEEPTGLGAVVEADTGRETPTRWIYAIDSLGGVRWLRFEAGLGVRYTWAEIQEDAIATIRVLSEGVHPDEAETPEVYAGMVITEWPEDDEHLRGWVIEDCGWDEWRWEPRERDQPGQHWRRASWGSPEPSGGPWTVLKKANG